MTTPTHDAMEDDDSSSAHDTIYKKAQASVRLFASQKYPVSTVKHLFATMAEADEDDDDFLMDHDDSYTSKSSGLEFERDPGLWLQRETEMQQHVVEAPTPRTKSTLTGSKSPFALSRADTPIMKNTTQQSKDGEDDETPPCNVQSPWVALKRDAAIKASALQKSSVRSPPPDPRAASLVPGFHLGGSSYHDDRRYFDAFCEYQQEKLKLATKGGLLTQQGEAYTAAAIVRAPFSQDLQHFQDDERSVDLRFLLTLKNIAWDRHTNQKDPDERTASEDRREGNFWLLVARLRELLGPSPSALFWPDDEAAAALYRQQVDSFTQSLVANVHSTPRQVTQTISSGRSNVPMILQRRIVVSRWLEECFKDSLRTVPPPMANAQILTTSEKFRKQGFPVTNKDAGLLKSCLELILSGQKSEALELARIKTPFRAAMWSGSEPYGYDDQEQELGNEHRPLWRKMMWLHSESLHDPNSGKEADEEGAIAAILALHVKNAFINPVLRGSWEKCLYVLITAVLGRYEDEVVYQLNENKRHQSKGQLPFPGMQYQHVEKENLFHLMDDLSNMDEKRMIDTLNSSPFLYDSPSIVQKATSALIIGQVRLEEFAKLTLLQDASTWSGNEVRFLAHLALYAHSVMTNGEVTSPSSSTELISQWKDAFVERHLRCLAMRPDSTWHMWALYGSQLPSPTQEECLAGMLALIENDSQRAKIIESLRSHLQGHERDLVVLKMVVRLVMDEKDDSRVIDPDIPTPMAERKMRSILWLCCFPEHGVEALKFANELLRQFFLAGNVPAAYMFLYDVFPSDAVVGAAAEKGTGFPLALKDSSALEVSMVLSDNVADEDAVSVTALVSEQEAFKVFLEAKRDYSRWQDVINETPAEIDWVDAARTGEDSFASASSLVNKSRLNPAEKTIAIQMDRRSYLHAKRTQSNTVIQAAKKAHDSLVAVLIHPGGWLHVEEVDSHGDCRSRDLLELRTKLLPSVMGHIQDVCLTTASWMSASLDDVRLKLGSVEQLSLSGCQMVRSETALSELNGSSLLKAGNSPMNPQYWTNLSVNLLQTAVSEQFLITSTIHHENEIVVQSANLCSDHELYSLSSRDRQISKFCPI
jgi:Nuclear pore protein 84 / 107